MKRFMRKQFFVVVWATVFFLLTIAAPGHSAGMDDDSGWTKVTYDLVAQDVQVNGCYGDDHVVLTGQLTGEIWTKVQSDGAILVKEDFSVVMSGVGQPSGANYTFTDNSRSHIDDPSIFPFTFEFHRVGKLIGEGVPDMKLHYRVKLTIDEDGIITHDVNWVAIKCNP